MKTLYISDLDGTLLNSDGKASDFTVSTVNSLVEKGMNISFATARSMSSASYILPRFKLKIPAVMMNGVFLADIGTLKPQRVCYMESDTAKMVVDAFLMHGRPPMVYSFTKEGFLDAEYSLIKNDYEREFIEKRKKLYHSFLQVEQYLTENTVYINGIDEKEVIDAVCSELDKISSIKYSAYLDTYSGDKYFLEVYSSKAGKRNATIKLKEMYGFDRIVAIGDNGNDVELLELADLAVAVGNAQPIAKAVADVVIDTNDNDAVAKFLLSEYERGTF